MRRVRLGVSLLVLLPTMGPIHPLAACPNCKEAVAAQPSEVAVMASGYNWSILLMLGMPFTLLGTGGILVARAVKRGAFPEL